MGLGATAEDAYLDRGRERERGLEQHLLRGGRFPQAEIAFSRLFFDLQLGAVPPSSREEFGPQNSRNPSVRAAARRLLMQRVQALRSTRRPSEEKA
jgi:hypothetical protein